MRELPVLTADAVIDVAREGGIAYMPRLAAPRRIALAELDETQRLRISEILRRSLPLGQQPGLADSPGRGDQRYYRIQITWTRHNGITDFMLLIPESKAPEALVDLWRHGGECVGD